MGHIEYGGVPVLLRVSVWGLEEGERRRGAGGRGEGRGWGGGQRSVGWRAGGRGRGRVSKDSLS